MSGDSNSSVSNSSQNKRELLEKLLREKAAQKQSASSESKPLAVNLAQKPIQQVDRSQDNYPLSFAQRRMWLLDQLEPGNPAYNLSFSIRLRGNLNVDALVTSVAELIRRHEMLRTTFIMVEDEPAQVIHAPFRLSIPVVSAPSEENELQKLIHEESSRPFDLLQGPLLRAKLLNLDAAEHIFIFTCHHIISDGWSVVVFVRELQTLYQAFINDRTSPLPDLPIQYVDFAHWQEEWLRGDVLESQLGYWKKQLAAPLPVLDLPTDYARPKVQTFNGASEIVILSESVSSALKELSRKEGCTIFMNLLAVFSVLLYRQTGQADIVIGSPIAGRSRSELEGLIGFFLNTLVMRINLDSGPTFHEMVQRVRNVSLHAYANQDVPFEKLLEELHPERHLSRTPVFQVFFNMLNFNDGAVDFADLKGEFVQSATEARFDLTLYAREENKCINLTLVYNSDLFSQERMTEMGRQLELLVAQIVQTPERSIDEYSLLTPQARMVLPDPTLVLDEPKQTLLPEMISNWAKQTPDAMAVEKDRQGWTYKELDEHAAMLAHELICSGVKPGDTVAVSGSRSFNLIVSMLAVLKSGGVLLTIDNGLPIQRKRLMLEHASAKALIYVGDAQLLDLGWADTLGSQKIHVLSETSRNWSEGADASLMLLPPLSGDDAAYIFFTSGTTGVPKGVLGVHKGLGHFLNWQRDNFSIQPGDRVAQLTGLSFDVVLRDVFVALVSGATLCLPDDNIQLDADATLKWLQETNITVVHTVPTLAQTWLTSISTNLSLPNLRWIFFAGEPLKDSLIEKWRAHVPQGRIVNLYGPTETTMAKCFFQVPDQPVPGIQPVGRPLPQTQALVIGKHGQMCGLGEPGEIVIRTPFRTRGYVNLPEENDKKFILNPFREDEQDKIYFTGDQGRFRPDGVLEILGRNDDQIKIRGLRVELGEIESALSHHPAVKQAVVVAWQGQDNDKRLIGYIIPSAVQFPKTHELKGYLQQYLPSYMIPTHFVLIDDVPLTPNGKLNRRALPEPDIRSLRETVFIAPQTQLQELLAEIWSDVLQVEKVSVQENFFELGGHSLLATQIMSRVRRIIQVELPLRVLFEYPTIASMATAIKSLEKTTTLDIPPLRPLIHEKPPRLSFSQERMWFIHQLAPESAAYNMPSGLHIQGALNTLMVEQAFNEIIERHAVLRTTFDVVEGFPVQIISPEKIIQIPLYDLRSLSEDNQENQVRQISRTTSKTSFDLVNGPLLRAVIIRLGEDDYLLFVCLHHIVSDQWSGGVFIREFAAIYNALCTNNPILLDSLPVQYADYGVWQRNWLKGDILQSKLAFWKKQLEGISVLDLPTDYPRPAMTTFNGALERQPLSASMIDAISKPVSSGTDHAFYVLSRYL